MLIDLASTEKNTMEMEGENGARASQSSWFPKLLWRFLAMI